MDNNSITKLDISKNNKLNYIMIRENGLTYIKLADSMYLHLLALGRNKLTELNIPKNTVFDKLWITENPLDKQTIENLNLIKKRSPNCVISIE